jgi:hypothetical protein
MAAKFPKEVVQEIDESNSLGIRAGRKPHRFIRIWAVVVEGRVFVRSWSLKPRSWYRTFLEDPTGRMTVNGKEFRVRAVSTRSERLKDLISAAYLDKYHTPGSIKFAKDLGQPKSRNTTIELTPA